MSIRISLYDFFAYTIPGLFIMFEILYMYSCFHEVNLQLLLKLGFSQLIIFGIIAYILGHIFSQLSSKSLSETYIKCTGLYSKPIINPNVHSILQFEPKSDACIWYPVFNIAIIFSHCSGPCPHYKTKRSIMISP